MILSVSQLMIGNGAAIPSRVVNLSMGVSVRNRSSRGRYFGSDALTMPLFGLPEIIGLLHGEPHSGPGAKRATNAQRRLRSNRATAGNYLLDTLRRHPQLQTEGSRAQATRLKLFLEHVAGVHTMKRHHLWHRFSSVIVHDLHVICVSIAKREH